MSNPVAPLSTPEPSATRQPRKNNPEKTREDILQAAINEFVQQGLAGARVDAIAERTATSKRMIYYYFGSKEQLYVECLVKLYGDIRKTEQSLDLESLPPEQAICRLAEFTFDHQTATSISCAWCVPKTSITASTSRSRRPFAR